MLYALHCLSQLFDSKNSLRIHTSLDDIKEVLPFCRIALHCTAFLMKAKWIFNSIKNRIAASVCSCMNPVSSSPPIIDATSAPTVNSFFVSLDEFGGIEASLSNCSSCCACLCNFFFFFFFFDFESQQFDQDVVVCVQSKGRRSHCTPRANLLWPVEAAGAAAAGAT